MPLQYLTREELYERIWEAPMTAIAQPLSIPAGKLTEYALEMAVPRPPSGYWTKRRSDKAVLRPPLPRRPPGAAAWVESGAAPFWNRAQSEVLAAPLPPPPVFTESLEELGERLDAPTWTILRTIRPCLPRPHRHAEVGEAPEAELGSSA